MGMVYIRASGEINKKPCVFWYTCHYRSKGKNEEKGIVKTLHGAIISQPVLRESAYDGPICMAELRRLCMCLKEGRLSDISKQTTFFFSCLQTRKKRFGI